MTSEVELGARGAVMAKKASLKHPDDIDAAVEMLRVLAKRDGLHEEFIASFEIFGYRQMVHIYRKHQNDAHRNGDRGYRGRAKVLPGAAVASAAEESILNSYFIAGKTLGSLRGEELPNLIAIEMAKSECAQFNASLLLTLKRRVKANQTVREVVNEKQMAKIFHDLKKKAA